MKKTPYLILVATLFLLAMLPARATSPKVYTAHLFQIGEQAPNAVVLYNTLGDVTWTRISTGVYRGNCVGCFPYAKTYVDGILAMWPDELMVWAYWQTEDYVIVKIVDWQGDPIDDALGATPIRVEVYP